MRVDVEAFYFAGAVAQIVGFFGVVGAHLPFAHIRFHLPQVGIGHREIRIERDGLLEKWNRLPFAFVGARLQAQTVVFQCLQRRGAGLGDRRVVFLNRRQRFTQFSANVFGGLAQRVQDVIFVRRLGGYRRQRFTGSAVRRIDDQAIRVANLRDGTFQRRGALGALTNLSRQFVGHPRRRRLAHVLQRLLHLPVGENVQQRRLRQLRSQPLAQGAVKHRITRGVGEIGEDDRTLGAELRCAVRIEVAAGDCGQNQNRCDREQRTAALR